MNKNNILLLFKSDPTDRSLNNYSNVRAREFVNNGAVLLDYNDVYMRLGNKKTESYIEEFIEANKISIVICILDQFTFYFDVCFFERLRKKVFMVMLAGDSEHYYEVRDQYYAQAMDLVVGDEDSIVAKLDEIGVDAVHYFAYYDTARFYKIEGAPKDIDVSFVGLIKDKAGRTDYINYLLANNVPVETYGIGTKNGLLDAGGYIKVIAGSKINLSFSGISTITRLTRKYTIHKRKKGLKARVFEVAFCGGFVLSEYFPGIEDLFQVGTEIDIFHDKEELLEKIKYYLAHDEQRETIASNGYARALRDYDITLSLPKLLADIEERKEKKTFKPSEIYLDEEFLRNYATSRVGLLVRFIKSRKWKFALEELKLIFKYRKLDWFQIRIIFIEEILDEFPNVKKFLKIIFKRDK